MENYPGEMRERENITSLTKKLISLVNELDIYLGYQKEIQQRLDRLFEEYQRGSFDYLEYEKRLKQFLKGKSKEEVLKEYELYINSLLSQIDYLRRQLTDYYKEKFEIGISAEQKAKLKEKRVKKPIKERAGKGKAEEEKEGLGVKDKGVGTETGLKEGKSKEKEKKAKERISRREEKEKAKRPEAKAREKQKIRWKTTGEFLGEPRPREGFRIRPARELKREEKEKIGGSEKKKEEMKWKEEEKWKEEGKWKEEKEKKKEPRKKPEAGVETIREKEKAKEKEKRREKKKEELKAEKPIKKLSWPEKLIKQWSYGLKQRMKKEKEIFASEVSIKPTLLDLKRKSNLEALREEVTPKKLREEARKAKEVIEKKEIFKPYEIPFVASLANVLMRKYSIKMIKKYPEFFRKFYDTLRMANLPLMSNTYVNMTLLFTLTTFIVSIILAPILFIMLNQPLYAVIFRSVFFTFFLTAGVFLFFYSYPYSRVKERQRDMKINLPFAINDISAVAQSGLPPTEMFRLVARTREFGEISVELEKVVEMINLFGYDFLTAINTVAANVPEPEFREFLTGLLTTVESGGNIKDYLIDKSKETMLNYKLEREKYIQLISTYSDLYLGLLIAAPLFFVITLSLISILGGKVAGIEVERLIILGTYVFLPLLDILFLFFLHITKKEVY